jgi:hypothetical protein
LKPGLQKGPETLASHGQKQLHYPQTVSAPKPNIISKRPPFESQGSTPGIAMVHLSNAKLPKPTNNQTKTKKTMKNFFS